MDALTGSARAAYIDDSLARRSADDELTDMLAEMDAEHGEPTAEDRAWARQAPRLEP